MGIVKILLSDTQPKHYMVVFGRTETALVHERLVAEMMRSNNGTIANSDCWVGS